MPPIAGELKPIRTAPEAALIKAALPMPNPPASRTPIGG